VHARSATHRVDVGEALLNPLFFAGISPRTKWLLDTMTDWLRHGIVWLTMKTKADTANDKEKEKLK
jgi:hypothetical protein